MRLAPHSVFWRRVLLTGLAAVLGTLLFALFPQFTRAALQAFNNYSSRA